MSKKKRTKTSYSHPYTVVYHGNLPPHPSYETLNMALANVRKKLGANAEWAKKFSNESLPEIFACQDRLQRLSYLDAGAEFHDRCTVDLHSGTVLDFTIINQAAH